MTLFEILDIGNYLTQDIICANDVSQRSTI